VTSRERPLRVVVADDSDSVRTLITSFLVEDGIDVVGDATDGLHAVDLVTELRPDVVTMDILMPRLDGLAATAAIMTHVPTPIVVVCDTSRFGQVDLSFQAMTAGALEVIPKPSGTMPVRQWGRRLTESVRLMADVPLVRRRRGSVADIAQYRDLRYRLEAFGIVASTGGPPAVAQLLGALPAGYCVPLLVVQHIAPGFTRGLARWLDGITPLHVVEAEDGAHLEGGTVYLPPDGHEMIVGDGGVLRVSACRSPEHGPSGDRLLESLAAAYGSRAGGAVLTGMGDDGARGLRAIRERGGFTMAQDEASSVVWGMPAAAMRMGATDQLFPIEHMAIKLVQLGSESKGKGR